jgi:hypothetical protein
MAFNQMVFAGVDLSIGRKPVTFAALDRELNILEIQKSSVSEAILCLEKYEKILLGITTSARKPASSNFKQEIAHINFSALSEERDLRQFMETKAQDCFRTLGGAKLLSGRTFEGRIQRSLILYEEGFQIPDPMDFFEEITRHKLIQGILPFENLYSARELDSMVAAYIGWMTYNRPKQVSLQDGFILPVQE